MAETEITVQELLQRIDGAVQEMSARNSHRRLLLQCRIAIVHLAEHSLETEVRTPAGLIVP